jgi:hypothetical protein
MTPFDHAEERREANESLHYEEWLSRKVPDDIAYDDAYEPDDPKSEGFHERYADVWDMREGK